MGFSHVQMIRKLSNWEIFVEFCYMRGHAEQVPKTTVTYHGLGTKSILSVTSEIQHNQHTKWHTKWHRSFYIWCYLGILKQSELALLLPPSASSTLCIPIEVTPPDGLFSTAMDIDNIAARNKILSKTSQESSTGLPEQCLAPSHHAWCWAMRNRHMVFGAIF